MKVPPSLSTTQHCAVRIIHAVVKIKSGRGSRLTPPSRVHIGGGGGGGHRGRRVVGWSPRGHGVGSPHLGRRQLLAGSERPVQQWMQQSNCSVSRTDSRWAHDLSLVDKILSCPLLFTPDSCLVVVDSLDLTGLGRCLA